jgi:rhamnose transport system permease protein
VSSPATVPDDVASGRPGAALWRLLQRLGSMREFSLLGIYAVLVIGVGAFVSEFLTFANYREILVSVAILMIVVIGETPVVLTRNIDISVGSVVGLSAFVCGNFISNHPHTSVVLVVAMGCAIGLGLGAINGLLVGVGRVPSIMATLGTLYVYRGFDSLIAGGKEVTASTVPDSYAALASDRVAGIPVMVLVAVVIGVVVGLVLRHTSPGRQLYAVGSNPDAARAAGFGARRLVFAALCFSGLMAGLGGVLWSAQFATVTSDAASGLELQVVAAVVVGGVNVFGGVGTVFGAMLGALLLATISNALALTRVSQLWLQAIAGAAILVAVTLDHYAARRALGRRLARRRVG